MATRAQLEAHLSNPNVRKFLDFISKAEGTTKHGYNTNFGGSYLSNLSAHPRVKRSFTDLNGKKNVTTASGRYQFIANTWDSQAKKLGLTDFQPRSQDLGALGIIADFKALDDIVKGDFTTAIKKLGTQWASLPTSKVAQPKHSWATANKWLGQGGTSPVPRETVPTNLNGALTQVPSSVQLATMDLQNEVPLPNVPRETSRPNPLQSAKNSYATTLGTGYVPRETLSETLGATTPIYEHKRVRYDNPYAPIENYHAMSLGESLQDPDPIERGFGVFVE